MITPDRTTGATSDISFEQKKKKGLADQNRAQKETAATAATAASAVKHEIVWACKRLALYLLHGDVCPQLLIEHDSFHGFTSVSFYLADLYTFWFKRFKAQIMQVVSARCTNTTVSLSVPSLGQAPFA